MKFYFVILLFFPAYLFSVELLHLSPALNPLIVVEHPQLLKDTSHRDYNEAYALLRQNKFDDLPLHVKSFGLSDATYWVAFKLKNTDAHNLFLEFQYDQLTHVDCFVFKENNLIQSSINGNVVKIEDRDVKDSSVRFILSPSDELLTYLFKITSNRPILIAMSIGTQHELDDAKLKSMIFVTFFTGCLCVFFFFSVMLYVAFRAKEYLFYALYLVCLLMHVLYIYNYTYIVTQEYLWINNSIKMLSAQGFHVAFLLFTFYFLEVQHLFTFLSKITYILCILSVIGFMFLLVQGSLQIIAFIAGLMTPMYCLMVGVIAVYHNVKFSKWYLVGLLGFYSGILFFWLMQLGLIDFPSQGKNVLVWGCLWEMIIFVYMIIMKIKRIKTDYGLIQSHMIETEKERVYQSRYISIGKTIGNIAHQWKQPLNALGAILTQMKGSLILEPRIKRKKLIESLDMSFEVLKHLSETIDTFYNFLLKSYTDKSRFYVSDELESIQKMLEYSFKNAEIKLHFKGSVHALISGNPNEFIQVLLNILLNAQDQFHTINCSNACIDISVFENDATCMITIQDNAGGISVTPIERIFEVNISTKQESAGVGLYICKDIIENRFKGNITVENKNNGACFTLYIPVDKGSLN